MSIYKAQRQINTNILNGAKGMLDGDFRELEKMSVNFNDTVTGLNMKIEKLKKENQGLKFAESYSPLFNSLALKFMNMNDVYKQVDGANVMSDPTQYMAKNGVEANSSSLTPNQNNFIDALAASIGDNITEKLEDSKEEKSKPQETEKEKRADRFYKRMLDWLGYEKARNAIQATREESKASSSKVGKVFSKTAMLTKSALDNLLDLPMFISTLLSGWVVKFTGAIGTALGMALVLGKKLLLSKFGLIGVTVALLSSDKIREFVTLGIKKIFGEESVDKMSKALEGFDWETALTGAALFASFKGGKGVFGTLLAGTVTAIAGALLFVIGKKLVDDITNANYDDLMEKVKGTLNERKILENAMQAQAMKISSLQAAILMAGEQGNEAYKAQLEKQLEIALIQKGSMDDRAKALAEIQHRAQKDADLVKEWGWWGKLIAGIGKATDDMNNWVASLMGYGSMNELGAFLDRKILDGIKWMGEKYDEFKKTIVDLIELPGKILDSMGKIVTNKVSEMQQYVYDKTGGLFGADSVKGKGTIGKFTDSMAVSPFAPGAGAVAKPDGQPSDTVRELMLRKEALEKEMREKTKAMINATSVNNSTSSVINTNNNSTVQIRSSPIDSLFDYKAW